MTNEPVPRLPTVAEKMGMPNTKAPPIRLAPIERDFTAEAAAANENTRLEKKKV